MGSKTCWFLFEKLLEISNYAKNFLEVGKINSGELLASIQGMNVFVCLVLQRGFNHVYLHGW